MNLYDKWKAGHDYSLVSKCECNANQRKYLIIHAD